MFKQHIITYLTVALYSISVIILYRTSWGLAIRAVGENPLAADTVGIKVERTRYVCTILGGLLAGMAGGYLTLAHFNSFFSGMTAGRGWIAIAAV